MPDLIACSCGSCAVHRLAEANVEQARSLMVTAQCTKCGKATARTMHIVLVKRGAITCDRKGCPRG